MIANMRSGQDRPRLLLAPAVAVMNRLTYPRKFALISLLLALQLGLVMYLLTSEMNDRIEFAQKEIQGDQYLRPCGISSSISSKVEYWRMPMPTGAFPSDPN